MEYPVSRREFLPLQHEASRVIIGLPDAQSLDIINASVSPAINTDINDLSFPRRSERLAAQLDANSRNDPLLAQPSLTVEGNNHLLAQPSLTVEKKAAAFETEQNAWKTKTEFVPIRHCHLPPNANIFGSHAIFKRKDCGRLNARIVPWGHRDAAKHEKQTDFSCQKLETFCLVMSIVAE